MKKATQNLFNFAIDKLCYHKDKIQFGNYVVKNYCGTKIIEKQQVQIGVIDNERIFINSAVERFLFGISVEKNIGEIVTLINESETREGENSREELRKKQEKIDELEDKLAQSVANNIDLDTNRKA